MDMAIRIRGVTKRFGPTLANDNIDLDIRQGEIHAILGENGAGKSTLVNILYGLYRPDAGSIAVCGQPARIDSPADAASLGIQMVHQHFMLAVPFTVAENLVIGHEPRRLGVLLDRRRSEEIVRSLSQRYGLDVDPRAHVEDLSVGARQRVEILKALYRDARILILDEPTAVLTPPEIVELFRIMQRLKEEGKTVIFITHKLREVMSTADRLTVLRHGRLVGTHDVAQLNEDMLVEMMVGRLVDAEATGEARQGGQIVLRVRGLRAPGHQSGVEALRGVDLDIREGEIMGIAGVEGNGQLELVEALVGLRPVTAGEMQLDGVSIVGRSPREILGRGLVCIHEDRQARGVIGEFTVEENLILGEQHKPPLKRGFFMDRQAIHGRTRALIEGFDIIPPRSDIQARYLSGGNQQKLVVAREMTARPLRLLIASQPTRGLDVGATEFIHRKLRELRDRGTAVLLVSADLDEVRLLSSRLAVMFKGEVIADRPKGEYRDAELGALMLRGRQPVELASERM